MRSKQEMARLALTAGVCLTDKTLDEHRFGARQLLIKATGKLSLPTVDYTARAKSGEPSMRLIPVPYALKGGWYASWSMLLRYTAAACVRL